MSHKPVSLPNKAKTGWYYRLPFSKKTALWGVIFLLPWLLGFLLFFLQPAIQLIPFSLSKLELKQGSIELTPVGTQNFEYIFTRHPDFNRLLLTNLAEAVPAMLLVLVFSLIVAVILNGKFRGRTIARAVFFIPIIMATDALTRVVGGVAAQTIAEQQGSQLTSVSFLAGFISNMLPSAQVAKGLWEAVSSIFDTVLLSGVQTLIFLGGLQSISPQLYEVAKIEGSTGYETFWKVTLPMLSPLILTAAVYTLADHFLRSPIVDLAYRTAFGTNEWGRSAAMSLVFLLTSVVVIGIVSFIISRRVFYYD